MPRCNGMGPNRMGPMSGRAPGYCAGRGIPDCLIPVSGRGPGRGNRNMFFATGLTGWQRAAVGLGGVAMSREEELAGLHSEVEAMEEAKKAAQERIAELEKGEGSKE